MASKLRQLIPRQSLLFTRQCRSQLRFPRHQIFIRHESNTITKIGDVPKINELSKVTEDSFWTSGRVIILTAFTASLAYIFGVGLAMKVPHKVHKPHYANEAETSEAVHEIQRSLGDDSVNTEGNVLWDHGFSRWSLVNARQLPVAVVYPRTTDEVSKIAKICHKHRVPMIPFSGGSSVEGHYSAPFGGISIDFAKMDRIVEFRPDDMDVTVQPSVPWMTLNDEIKSEGLFFPVDPGPTAQVGGMVATGCSGTNAVRYGTMRDWVINLTVVLADGTIIKTRKRPRKSSAGYNLTGLFVGSEGTLGMITEATLKLAVLPQETTVAVVTFPTIHAAAAAAARIMRTGVPIAAMEIMDEKNMEIVNQAGMTMRKWAEVPTMFFKFSGTKNSIKEDIAYVRGIVKSQGCIRFEFTGNSQEQEGLWSARKQALWSIHALREDDDEIWSTDVAVPFSRLPDIIEATKKDLDSLGLFASTLGHVGDGNFHTSIRFKKHDPEQKAKVEKCVHDMVDRALEMDGTCTGEHGIGLGKKDCLLQELGVHTVNAMKHIKTALDPHWLMNPGKIIDF